MRWHEQSANEWMDLVELYHITHPKQAILGWRPFTIYSDWYASELGHLRGWMWGPKAVAGSSWTFVPQPGHEEKNMKTNRTYPSWVWKNIFPPSFWILPSGSKSNRKSLRLQVRQSLGKLRVVRLESPHVQGLCSHLDSWNTHTNFAYPVFVSWGHWMTQYLNLTVIEKHPHWLGL